MTTTFDEFKGKLPYASELFGVYKPLLGWKSKQTQIRMQQRTEYSTRVLTREIIDEILDNILLQNTISSMITTANIPQVNSGPRNIVISATELQVVEFIQLNKKFPNTKEEWGKIFKDAKNRLRNL